MLTALILSLSADGPADPRADLQRFSARLEQRLFTACRPAEPMVFMSALPETRYVYLEGLGAVLLLPPRSLPTKTARTDQSPPEISVSAVRPGVPPGPQLLVVRKPTDLTNLEATIRETRKEAERMRAQADAAFADAERQLMPEMRPGSTEAVAGATLPLPWTFFLEDFVEDNRAPEQVERDVTTALVTSLLEDSSLLKSLKATDMVTVSVELVSRPQPWVRPTPARTVIVRALKADLDAYNTGKLPKDELLKRVMTKAY